MKEHEWCQLDCISVSSKRSFVEFDPIQWKVRAKRDQFRIINYQFLLLLRVRLAVQFTIETGRN